MRFTPVVVLAVLGWLSTAACAAPMRDCAAKPPVAACLDAMLKAANQKLNATLKSAQERLEQLQAHGRRPVLGTFIDSQRKFNAYRDAQCGWQGIRAPKGESTADYVKDCQIRSTLAREEELAQFVAGESSGAASAATAAATFAASSMVQPEPETQNAQPDSQPASQPEGSGDQSAPVSSRAVEPEQSATSPMPSATARSSLPWRLVQWVANGRDRSIVAGSEVTIAFDPSGKIAGNATLNYFSGSFRFDVDGRLEWPRAGFVLTKMTGPQALLAQERAFLEALRRTKQYRAEAQQLILSSQSGATILTFSR